MRCIIRLSYHDDPHAASPLLRIAGAALDDWTAGSWLAARYKEGRPAAEFKPSIALTRFHHSRSAQHHLLLPSARFPEQLAAACSQARGTIALETHHKTRLLLMPESPGSASMPPFPAVISCSQSICRQATSTALSPCSAGSSRLGGATCHFGGWFAGCRCSQRPHVAVGLSESCSRFILRSCISHCSLSAVSPRPPMLTREDSSAATLHASDDHAQCSTQR